MFPLIKLASEISDQGICQVSSLFRTLFSNVKYQSDKAVRKLMQLTVAVVLLELQGPGSQCLYVIVLRPNTNYLSFINIVQQFLHLRNTQESKADKSANLPKESLRLLCSLASSVSDRMLIKYTACKSFGLSSKAAKRLYGFENFHLQEEKIYDAIEKSYSIRKTIKELAKAESTASLRVHGISIASDTGSDDDSDDETKSNVSTDDSVETLKKGRTQM